MNRLLACMLVFCACCYAQAPKPKASPVKSKALVACEKNEVAALESLTAATNERDKLRAENAALTKKYGDAVAVLTVLSSEMAGKALTDEQTKQLKAAAPGDALNLGQSIEQEENQLRDLVRKLADHDSAAVDKYNALLADYKDYVTRVGIQLAQIGQANRVNNALAIYQMMPKYTPPQTLNINVTDCTKLPALCVH